MTQAQRPRIFFALLPGQQARERIAALQHTLPPAGGHMVPAANLHLTLLFIGAVARADIRKLRRDCSAISVAPFELVIDTCGWWKRAGIAWLGPTHTGSALASLVTQLRLAAACHDLPMDSRDYKPHITLARKVRRKALLPLFEPIRWQATEYCLMESVSGADGVRYEVIARWPLR